MKKLVIAFAAAVTACVVNAAAVGWNLAGASAFAGDAYNFFVIGQNGATDVATITALLDAGKSVDAYAFGSGTIAANGVGGVAATASGKSLDAGSYTSFFVVFDSASPAAGSSNYAVVSGASTLTKSIGANTATTVFTSGSQQSFLANTDNWKSYGAVPEPTSGLLMLLGVAGLALKRKRA